MRVSLGAPSPYQSPDKMLNNAIGAKGSSDVQALFTLTSPPRVPARGIAGRGRRGQLPAAPP